MLKITMPQSTIFMGSKAEHQVTLIVVRMADGGVASGVACCIVVPPQQYTARTNRNHLQQHNLLIKLS